MPRARPCLAVAVCAALSGGVAAAADAPVAIGLVAYSDAPGAGAAICTGTLVAPDLVLTAAHCVRKAVDAPGDIRFLAGWANGVAVARRRGVAVIVADPVVGEDRGLVDDVALVRLDRPIGPDEATPLPVRDVSGREASVGPLTLIAYRRDAPGAVDVARGCGHVASFEGLIGLSCTAVSGNSGAPVLERDAAGWHIVAVMVASDRRGAIRAWATLPPSDLRGLIDAAR